MKRMFLSAVCCLLLLCSAALAETVFPAGALRIDGEPLEQVQDLTYGGFFTLSAAEEPEGAFEIRVSYYKADDVLFTTRSFSLSAGETCTAYGYGGIERVRIDVTYTPPGGEPAKTGVDLPLVKRIMIGTYREDNKFAVGERMYLNIYLPDHFVELPGEVTLYTRWAGESEISAAAVPYRGDDEGYTAWLPIERTGKLTIWADCRDAAGEVLVDGVKTVIPCVPSSLGPIANVHLWTWADGARQTDLGLLEDQTSLPAGSYCLTFDPVPGAETYAMDMWAWEDMKGGVTIGDEVSPDGTLLTVNIDTDEGFRCRIQACAEDYLTNGCQIDIGAQTISGVRINGVPLEKAEPLYAMRSYEITFDPIVSPEGNEIGYYAEFSSLNLSLADAFSDQPSFRHAFSYAGSGYVTVYLSAVEMVGENWEGDLAGRTLVLPILPAPEAELTLALEPEGPVLVNQSTRVRVSGTQDSPVHLYLGGDYVATTELEGDTFRLGETGSYALWAADEAGRVSQKLRLEPVCYGQAVCPADALLLNGQSLDEAAIYPGAPLTLSLRETDAPEGTFDIYVEYHDADDACLADGQLTLSRGQERTLLLPEGTDSVVLEIAYSEPGYLAAYDGAVCPVRDALALPADMAVNGRPVEEVDVLSLDDGLTLTFTVPVDLSLIHAEVRDTRDDGTSVQIDCDKETDEVLKAGSSFEWHADAGTFASVDSIGLLIRLRPRAAGITGIEWQTTYVRDTLWRQEGVSAIELPAGLRTIQSEAFAGATGMQYVLLPEGLDVRQINADAFAGCDGLILVCHSREDEVYLEKTLGLNALVR